MISFNTARLLAAALCLGLGTGSVVAATTWTLNNSSSNEPVVSGWKASNNGTAIYSTSVGYWAGSGIGVGGESSSNGEHALDNNNGYEAALLSFDEQVNLDKVSIGWTTNDSDFFVLAYTGAGTFSGSLSGSFASLLSNGWTLVGNYSNPGVGTVSLGTPESLYSSFWLIGAGGFQSGVGVVNDSTTVRTCTQWWFNGSCRTYSNVVTPRYDYIKVAAVGGTVKPPPPPGTVSEPGSLALAGLGLIGLLGLRRARARA